MKSSEDSSLVEGGIVKATWRFGAPLAAGLALHGLFNFVDLAFVGRLDAGAIAAVTVAGVIVMIPMLLFDAVTGVAVAEMAQAHGARDRTKFHDVAREVLRLSWIAAIPCLLAIVPFQMVLARFFPNDMATLKAGTDYLDIMTLGSVSMFVLMSVAAVFRGVGDGRTPTVLLLGANLLNMLLNWVMMFGHWGCPAMGVAGAAWATVISRGIAALIGLFLLQRGTSAIQFGRHASSRAISYVGRLLRGGVLVALQLSVRVVAQLVIMGFAAGAVVGNSTPMVDGVGVATRLDMVTVFTALGWGAAATTVVGQNLGSGQPDRARRGLWACTAFAIVTGGIIALTLWIFRVECFAIMAPDASKEVLDAGLRYWRISLPFFPLLAIGAVISRGLVGGGRTAVPLVVDVLIYGLALPAAAWFSVTPPHAERAWWIQGAAHAAAALAYIAIVVFSGLTPRRSRAL